MTTIGRKPVTMTYEDVIEALGIKVIQPEENDNDFSEIIGQKEVKKHLKQAANIYKHPEDPKNKKATLYRNYLLSGNSGSGRTLTAFAFAKEVNLPIIVINSEKFVSERPNILARSLKLVLDQHTPAVVLFKKFEYITFLEEGKDLNVYNYIADYLSYYANSFFFAASINGAEYPDYILSKYAFSVALGFSEPTLPEREEMIKRFIAKFPYDPNIDINKIARNTIGLNAGKIIAMLASAYNDALIAGKEELDFAVIDATLSSNLYGYKKNTMSEKERKMTAYHEAGHVIAGYFYNPNYKVSKVEIAHRAESLGLTISEIDENKFSYTKEDYEAEIIVCYGGMAAEEIMLNTHTSGVAGDLAMATKVIELMVKRFGMSKSLGPISLVNDPTCFFSETLNKKADAIIDDMAKELLEKVCLIMAEYKDALIALSDALLEKETLYSEEVIAILSKYKK